MKRKQAILIKFKISNNLCTLALPRGVLNRPLPIFFKNFHKPSSGQCFILNPVGVDYQKRWPRFVLEGEGEEDLYYFVFESGTDRVTMDVEGVTSDISTKKAWVIGQRLEKLREHFL